MALAGTPLDVLPRLGYMVAEVLPFLLAVQAGALLAGAGLHRRPPGVAILSAALAAAFLLQIVAGLDDSVECLSWFSPYARWAQGDAYNFQSDAAYMAYNAGIVALCLPLARMVWLRKDFKG